VGSRVIRQRRGGRAIAAAIFAVITHLAILDLFLFTTPGFRPDAKEARSVSLDIVQSWDIRRFAQSDARAARPKRDFAGPGAPETPNPHGPPVPRASSSPAAVQIPSTPGGSVGSAILGNALRESVVGCAHADMAILTDAERQHCQDAFAARRADTPDLTELAISPEKRAIFDAAWKADHSPGHMAGVACLARFGGRKLQWLHPSEGIKLGPLPCYVFTPKATFSADAPHAPGW
jgi:hypothetical protein